ncbi:MAG: O-antigen ligase family protein [bacterium]
MPRFIKIIILILVFIRPFTSGVSGPSSNWFILIILFLLFLLCLVRIILKKEILYSSSLDLPLFLFAIAIIVGIFNSFSKNEAITQGFIFLSYFLLYFLVIHYPPSENKARISILLSCFLVSCYGIYQSLFGLAQTREFIQFYKLPDEFLGRASNKVFSTFIYPNAFAGYLVLVLPLAISLIFNLKKKFHLLLFCSSALLLLYSLYLTGSRGGFISFFFSLFLFFILRRKRILIILSLFLFLFVLIHYSIPPPSSLIARLGYARASLKIIRDNPAGTGISTFASMYFKYKLASEEETRMAHNNYLQIGVELGIFGLLAFIFLLVFIAIKGLNIARKNRNLEGYYIGSFAFFFHSIVDFDLYLPEITFIFFFFLGILFSFEKNEKKTSRLFALILIIPVIYLCFYSYKMMKAASLYEKAMDYIFTNEYVLAEKNLENAINLNKNPEWLITLGRLKEEKDPDYSLKLYRMAIEENPNFPYYNYCIARVLIKKGRNKEAIFFLKRASKFYPTNPIYRMCLDNLLTELQ